MKKILIIVVILTIITTLTTNAELTMINYYYDSGNVKIGTHNILEITIKRSDRKQLSFTDYNISVKEYKKSTFENIWYNQTYINLDIGATTLRIIVTGNIGLQVGFQLILGSWAPNNSITKASTSKSSPGFDGSILFFICLFGILIRKRIRFSN